MHPSSTNRISRAGFFFTTTKGKFEKGGLVGLTAAILPVAMLLLCVATSYATSATWVVNPNNADWNSADNWTPATVPNGPNDTAIFETTSQAGISISANTEVNGIIFNPSTHLFTITNGPSLVFTISGVGVTNNSGFTENFVISNTQNGPGRLAFVNSASAGDLIRYNTSNYATLSFSNSATAGNATFINSFGVNVTFSGLSTAGSGTFTNSGNANISFFDSSNAGSANVTLAGGTYPSSHGSSVTFANNSNASNAYFTINGSQYSNYQGATVGFADSSSAGSSTLVANSGVTGGNPGMISFSGNSTGAMARVAVFGAGSLNIGGHAAPGISIGSIEGDGIVSLGSRRLTVGANNIDTTFSGHIQDSNSSGSLSKTGMGTLVLANSNTYTGGTTIEQGILRASHDGAFGGSPQNGGYVSVGPTGTLTLDSGATNDYIGNRVSLSIVTGSTVNLDFSGASDRVRSLIVNGIPQPPGVYGGPASGAPNQLPQFTGTGTIIVTTRVVSRKVHGAAGSFDIDLPLTGPAGIECRSGGGSSDYQIVINFFDNVNFGNASVISGGGFVTSRSGSGTNTATINLSNMTNAHTVLVVLFDVNDGTDTNTFVIPISVLLGDITGNGIVNSSDVSQVRPGRPIDASNFCQDVTVNGVINSSDVSTVKLKSGTALP